MKFHRAAKESRQGFDGSFAQALDHASGLSYDYRLLAFPGYVDLCQYLVILAGGFPENLYLDGGGIGDFPGVKLEDLLANNFGGVKFLPAVGQLVCRVVGGMFREGGLDRRLQLFQSAAGKG